MIICSGVGHDNGANSTETFITGKTEVPGATKLQ